MELQGAVVADTFSLVIGKTAADMAVTPACAARLSTGHGYASSRGVWILIIVGS